MNGTGTQALSWSDRPHRAAATAIAIGMLFFVACSAGNSDQAKSQIPTAAKVDDFFIVDCLLPPEIRQLGRDVTYVTRRQATKTSARDCQIRGGEYTAYDRANYATSLKIWLPLAQQGDPAAQTYVGEIFEKGLGVKPDYAAAAVWYRRAAEKGYSRAAINLGSLYEQGLGVPKDVTQALTWYRRAAGLGELSFAIDSGIQAAELKSLRDEVAELRRELSEKQQALEKTQRELDKLRRGFEQRKSEVESERSALALLRKELEQLQKSEHAASAESRQLQRSIAEREARLATKDREVNDLRASLARLEKESNAQRAELKRLQQQTADAGPQIHLLEPELSITRGTAVARLSGSTENVLVIGRVESAQGLSSLTIDGREEKFQSGNTFRSKISVKDPKKPIRIVAVDRGGRKAMLEFLVPEPSPQSANVGAGQLERVGYPLPKKTISFGKYHALVIGNNDYPHLRPLKTAVNDAKEVARLLREQYRFNVSLLLNANRRDIISALNTLRERLTDEDNLLVYYAGHGALDQQNQRGHWQPIDAEPTNPANWISNIDITDMLNTMIVKQLLVVADSCYAGTLTRSAVGRLEPRMTSEEVLKVVETMARQRSRMVMTSGGVEPVLDGAGGANSVFARPFIELLQANTGVLPGQEMFRLLQLRVAAVAQRIDIRQVPEYAPIKFAGHEAGDFFFVRATN
jgi:hypothetical protein